MPKVAISSIRTSLAERQRTDLGDIEALAKSIQEHGLLENIGLDNENNLVYGFRRLTAAIMLGWDEIRAEYVGALTPEQAQVLELEENVRRHNLSWQEESKAISKIHQMKMEQDMVWTAEKTAELLLCSRRKVFNAMELSRAIDTQPEVAKAETQVGAMMRLTQIKQLDQRKTDAKIRMMAEASGMKPKTSAEVTVGDALQVLLGLPSDSVDFAVTNPPYGVDIESVFLGDRTIYKDAEEVIVPLLFQVAKEVYRVLKPDRWFVFFYPTMRLEEGKEILSRAGFAYQQVPCVWYKPNKILSSLSNPYQSFPSQYETFFWGRKGSPRFNKLRLGNVFVYDTPDRDDRIHPLQMPTDLWKEILEIGSVEGESVLEPFSGSGSCGVACIEASRNYRGIELSQEYADRANSWFQETRDGVRPAHASASSALPLSNDLMEAFQGLNFKS
jgi:site-specific DNA-methyltransferase (adenine-specific)